MFRTITTALSTLAIANLLLILAVVGWLQATDRLSRERVQSIRVLLAKTVTEENADRETEKAKQEGAAKAAEEAEKAKRPPVAAEQRLEIIREYEEQTRQKNERTQREVQDLLTQLDARRSELERDKVAFVKERDEFFALRDELAKAAASEQFEKSLKLYESLKAPEAADMLQTLLTKNQRGQVVAYLNAMQPRTAAKIVAEFQKKDPALAAQLLESLRTLGLAAKAAQAGP